MSIWPPPPAMGKLGKEDESGEKGPLLLPPPAAPGAPAVVARFCCGGVRIPALGEGAPDCAWLLLARESEAAESGEPKCDAARDAAVDAEVTAAARLRGVVRE